MTASLKTAATFPWPGPPAQAAARRPPPGTRVAVGMSGGVDSSVAAAWLVRQGYDVVGVMLRLWSEPGREAENRCCTLEAEDLARHVARILGIPFHVVDVRARFRATVVEDFFRGYLQGQTPNPCLTCNRLIRWGAMLEYAQEQLGAAYLATGHYARLRAWPAGVVGLRRGVDAAKDQSYVLAVLTQAQLQRTLLPVGEWTKAQVRDLAREWGLPVAARPDSQDLCFLAGDDYRAFLRRHKPEAARPGPIFSVEGRRLGQHQGLAFYTIGQRRGLGLSGGPWYVVAKDPARNALIVGPRTALGRREFWAGPVNWVWRPLAGPFRGQVKIRYRARLAAATLFPHDEGRTLRIVLDAPLRDITPGQAAVVYVDDWVIAAAPIVRVAMPHPVPAPRRE